MHIKVTLQTISEQLNNLSDHILEIRQEIKELRQQISEQIQDVLHLVDQRFIRLESKMDEVISKSSHHEIRIASLEKGYSKLESRVEKISRD